jgi:glutamate dehydrogenase (NAD(P)+)
MAQIIEYTDPVEHCPGFLVYDDTACRLAAGGCRMHPDVTLDTLLVLASRMALKQRVLGINVDGAKCGIAYDPNGPHREAVLRRFLEFLSHELRVRFSMGCDMGTRFSELERIAAELGLVSVKHSIRDAQEISEGEFRARIRLLDAGVGPLTLGERRAGHFLAHAALVAGAQAGHPARQLTCAIQGFGNLGRAAALAVAESQVRVTAVADVFGCVVDPRGLDIPRMVGIDPSHPVPRLLGDPLRLPSDALFDIPADVLILAGGADAMDATRAALLPVPVVVVGANCGLSDGSARLLADRGVLVIPDFIGGIGGSASMEALFGPTATPSPTDVLDSIAVMARELVADIVVGARDRGVTPRQVAQDIAAAARVAPDQRPYGGSPYRDTTPAHGTRGRQARPALTGGTQ